MTPATVVPQDSIAAAAQDSLQLADAAPRLGLIFSAPPSASRPADLLPPSIADSSLFLLAVLLLFLLIALSTKGNAKYFRSLGRRLTDTREREGMITDTVSENIFTGMLNILAAVALGIITYVIIAAGGPLSLSPPLSAAICIGLTTAYSLLTPLAMHLGGYMFSTRARTRLWLRGYYAQQALLGLILLPMALIALFNPQHLILILGITAGLFLTIKILFIIKGLRIFITNSYSVVIFSYYLCSLEIIPVIVILGLAYALCTGLFQ